jgi:hypothetical protein
MGEALRLKVVITPRACAIVLAAAPFLALTLFSAFGILKLLRRQNNESKTFSRQGYGEAGKK